MLALDYNDRIIDTLETLIALLETELGIVLANLRASGQDHLVKTDEGNDASNEDLIDRANANRRAAENVAKRLLVRMASVGYGNAGNNHLRPDSGFSSVGLLIGNGTNAAVQWEDSDR